MKHGDPRRQLLLPCIFAIFASLSLQAQPNKVNAGACDPTQNKAAQKIFEKAMKQSEDGMRRKMLRDALEVEPDYYEAAYQLGRRTYHLNMQEETYRLLSMVTRICPDYAPYAWFYLGKIELARENAAAAVKAFERFMQFEDGIRDDDYLEIKELLPKLKQEATLTGTPVPFNPRPLLDVSTPMDEYSASITPDNRYIYFTRKTYVERENRGTPGDMGKDLVELFYRSEFKDGKWTQGEAMERPFNLGHNNGAAAVTADNKAMYFVICENNLADNCDIWYTEWHHYRWKPLMRMPNPVNATGYWDSHPTISYDGNTLIFSSDRPGGYGGADLYITTRQADGSWSKPQNLGADINTKGNEITPFLHSDSQTLYFSSQGHDNLGGYDVFYSKRQADGSWSKPRNLGFPLNTKGDEISFFVSLDGKTAYMCSDELKDGKGNPVKVGGLDVFVFELHEAVRPEEVVLMEGRLQTPEGSVLGGTIEIRDENNNRTHTIRADSMDGKFVAMFMVGQNYSLTVKEEGMAFSQIEISTENMQAGAIGEVAMESGPVESGKSYRLNNIHFATNSSELPSSAHKTLRDFADWLKHNPSIRIRIEGHTDNVGQAQANLQLSRERAKSVYEFLSQQGIPAERMEWEGYGSSKPVASNQTEEGRAKNRRTEFFIK